MEVSGQAQNSAALSPGNCPHYPFNKRLGGSQSRSGRFGENFTSAGNRNDLPACNLVVQTVNLRQIVEQLLIFLVQVVSSTLVHQNKS